jgi:anti-anti-sigma regulatory factor
MMKIQTKERDGETVLEIEGRLAGAFVPELESCWQAALRREPKRNISVDLKNVTCVDRAGRRLLEAMYSSGVRFRRAGLGIQDILEEVMEQCGCKH